MQTPVEVKHHHSLFLKFEKVFSVFIDIVMVTSIFSGQISHNSTQYLILEPFAAANFVELAGCVCVGLYGSVLHRRKCNQTF